MYIFLDESKLLTKKWWKFILGWLVTSLKPWTIDKLYKGFLEHTWIKEKWWEIKSYDKKYRDKIENFYLHIKDSRYSKEIEFVWIYAKEYFDSGEDYYYCLVQLILHTIKYNKIIKRYDKINIICPYYHLNKMLLMLQSHHQHY